MQGLATIGQIESGFSLLERAEAKGLLFRFDNEGYPMFHNLLQACRFVGDVATHLQERLPVAVPLDQWFESSSTGQGIWLVLQLVEETSVLERRVLFTPAGLGLCKQANA